MNPDYISFFVYVVTFWCFIWAIFWSKEGWVNIACKTGFWALAIFGGVVSLHFMNLLK